MEHWKFDIAIRSGNGIHTFDGDTYTEDGADPRDLAQGALSELLRRRPELGDGQVVRCDYTQVR
ncbi:hypothetical protein ACFY41_14980 [Streptomyces syringium]|uniref:hypothetical protein n=1 Tax=Streptomyces syringium TaxID=76729 RepID=UPI003682B698